MNRKSAYKDLEKHRQACNRQRKRYYNKTSFAKRHKESWGPEEIEAVMRHEVSDNELSQQIGRSVQAIQIMRCRRNKHNENND